LPLQETNIVPKRMATANKIFFILKLFKKVNILNKSPPYNKGERSYIIKY
jgi:hypothetical protein